MAEIYVNNVRGELEGPITLTDTAIVLAAGHNFPAPGSDWYRATLYRWDYSPDGILEYDHETVKVIGLTDNTLTVERGLEGAAKGFDPGTRIELRMTAGTVATLIARTAAYTDEQLNALLDSAPGALDTLNELAAALGNDPNFATTVTNALADKVNKSHLTDADPHTQYAKSADLGSASTKDASGWTGLNADLLDGKHGSDFSPSGHNHDDRYIQKGIEQATSGTQMGSGAPPSISTIRANGQEGNVALTITNRENNGASAVMAFNRINNFAGFFGLDTDNKWKVGGWSAGNNAYEILHEDSYRRLLGRLNAGDVGSYAFMKFVGDTTSTSFGQFRNGANVRVTSVQNNDGNTQNGTWMCMGSAAAGQGTLWLRIS